MGDEERDEVWLSWAAEPGRSWAADAGAQVVPVDRLRLPRIALLDKKLRSSGEGPVQPRFRLFVAKKSPQWLGYIERRGGTDGALARLLCSAHSPAVQPHGWAASIPPPQQQQVGLIEAQSRSSRSSVGD